MTARFFIRRWFVQLMICVCCLLAEKSTAFALQDISDAISLNQQAVKLHQQGQTREAIPLAERAVAIVRAKLGPDHPNTASMMNNYAFFLKANAEYAKARPIFEQALKISRRTNGDNSPDTALALNNLAECLRAQGDFLAARPMYEEALRIYQRNYGDQHAETASSLGNLGALHESEGDFNTARLYYEQALRVMRSLKGDENLETALCENNLAGVLLEQGDFAAARKLYEKVLATKRRLIGDEMPGTAVSMNNLGYVLYLQNELAAARPLYEQSLKVYKKLAGEEHSGTAMALNNMGALLNAMGDPAGAKPYHEQALAIRTKVLGPEHPDTANSINNLGFLEYIQGNYAAARPHYDQALKIYQKSLGNDHPATATALNNLMTIEVPQGHWEAAAGFADQARHAIRTHVTRVLPSLSEKEQLLFLENNDVNALHCALSLALLRSADPAMADLSAAWLLNGKGVAQESLAARTLIGRDDGNPRLKPLVEKLQDVRRRLASLAISAPQSGEEAARKKNLDDLTAEEADLSRQLANASGQPVQGKPWVELSQLRQAIPADSVLIDIARFHVFNFQAKGKDKRFLEARYVAWVVPAKDAGAVSIVDLGPADAIESAVAKVREQIANANDPDSVLKQKGELIAVQRLQADLDRLADLLWKPLVDKVGKTKRLIVCPDGALWLLPWAIIPVAEEKCLLEEHPVHFVVSGRDLVNRDKGSNPPVNATLFADPDYNLDPDKIKQAILAIFPKFNLNPVETTRGLTIRSAIPRVVRLPNTLVESKAITPSVARLTKSEPQSYLDRYALESVVKRVSRPSILVLGTHGFFMPDQDRDLEHSMLSSVDSRAAAVSTDGKQIENPLLRCGMLFAGCNGKQSTGGDDGVLTGMEIVGMDLRGTDMVVLSACQTGLGKIRNGEGVAGLRQAFQLAGARSVIATLWEVPDNRDSMLIMHYFFLNLADGQSKDEALRNALLKRIESRRKSYAAAHPFYWAAWTLTGE